MKKKLLLGILPAMLVLAGCNPLSSYAAAGTKVGFQEDTFAHEELFGGLKTQPFNAPDPGLDPDGDKTDDIAIGVQSFVQDGKVSLRFVAAVSFASADAREKTDATWHRSVTSSTGDFVKEEGKDLVPACTTAYLSLSNNGEPYTIEQFNTEHGCVGKYTHFVVYTLLNVSLTTYANHFVSAYLSLSKNAEGGVEGESKAIAINVERTEKYTYDASNGYCYIDGIFSGTPRKIPATRVRNGSNKAEFEYVDFAEGDIFTINEFYNTKFYVHGSSECLEYEGNTTIKKSFEDDGTSAKKIKVKSGKDGSYGLYLNVTDNKLYTQEDAPYNFYVSGSMNGWAEKPGSAYYMSRPSYDNIAVSKTISFTAGQEFKVRNGNTWYDTFDGSEGNAFQRLDGGNIKCNVGGDYVVYLNGSYHIWIDDPSTN